jgi:hypothetical protein
LPLVGADQQVQMARALEVIRAQEKVRQQQQGHGKPIISVEHSGYRLVAVGSTVHWNRNWLVFHDFLFYFLKKSLGLEWGADSQKNNSPHPLFRWLAKAQEFTAKHAQGQGQVKTGPPVGFITCILHLAYALYLIAHHDTIPKRLLRRLRDPVTFMPAYYETLVAAAFAVAGFEIRNAETKATAKPTPEFRARSKKSGKVFEVEAKRKERWTASTANLNSDDFRLELERYVRGQIYNASRKALKNPVFWLELSIPTLNSESEWRTIAALTKTIVADAVKMTIDGQPVAPAYVVITNHTFLANEDTSNVGVYALLETVHIADYPFSRPMELEDALEGYDKHRDIFWAMDAWRIAQDIPVTFDGSPPELLSPDGRPQKIVQIGDVILAPDQDGKDIQVRVEEVCSIGDRAMLAVHDEATSRRSIISYPLTANEAKAAARYTDAVFGKSNASRKLREDDPFDLYDWLLNAYAETTPEQLAKLFREDAHLRTFEGLSPAAARIRLVREYTKAMWFQAQNRSAPPAGEPGASGEIAEQPQEPVETARNAK